MFRLAWRNLTQNKPRLVIAAGGTGLALTLVLFFGAVFAGATGRLTAYIDHAGADVWVSQSGVRTMHMSASALPASVVEQVRDTQGVDQAVPILYAEDMIGAGGEQFIVYVFGVPADAPMGGPWRVVEGTPVLAPGEAIVDRAIAAQAGVRVGGKVTVLGQEMIVAGLTAGTSSLVSSATFVRMDDFARVRGGGEVISFVLVRVSPGESPGVVAERIAGSVDGVTVQTRVEFASQERKLVSDMSADLIDIMNTAGYLTGLAVIVLTVYVATLTRRREYGVLKAIGVRNSRLYQVVVIQALLSISMGFVASLGATVALMLIIPRFDELLVLSLSVDSVLRVGVISTVLAGVAALLPTWQIARLEPLAAIRRR